MLKWLTRNDAKRGAKAVRRIVSPRGSVFSEFALVMPIVALVCSALIEIVGFWDAQIMANHAAWQVGRIAMVRGSDGLEFSSTISKKSKTGIEGSSMPPAIKEAFKCLDTYIQGANKLVNNRANIATMFLMSTCGIGYYGASPGQTLSDILKTLCQAGVDAITKGIPQWIKDSVKKISLPSIGGGGEGLDGIIQSIVGGLIDKVAEAVLTPIAEGLSELLLEAFENLIGEDGIKIDEIFSGKSAAARYARQIYGAASRIARAKSITGREVVTVTDMDDLNSPFMFAKLSTKLGRLAYPQVVDKDAKSDGYFVTGVHGWPANDGGLAMTHVQIDWPYEYGWLFPVVSGTGGGPGGAPVATGHSMVFTQPSIANDNLYSEGATAFDPGSYTNNAAAKVFEEIVKDMKNYLKFVRFSMKFRIGEESLSLHDNAWYAYSWKDCPEIKDLYPFSDFPGGGDYKRCWNALTDSKDQDCTMDTLRPYFSSSSYRYRDYFYWEGNYHKNYRLGSGNAGLADWYGAYGWLNYRDAGKNKYKISDKDFKKIHKNYKERFDADLSMGSDWEWLRDKIEDFAKRNNVNVCNIVKWLDGHDYEAWKNLDSGLHGKAKTAEASYAVIKDFVRREIIEIENILNGGGEYKGDTDDPVFDDDDKDVMDHPEEAEAKAREKWKKQKEKLAAKLLELDALVVKLRDSWWSYKRAVEDFEDKRADCVGKVFAEACMATLLAKRDVTIFDEGNDRKFSLTAGSVKYDIGLGTRQMLATVEDYQRWLNAAYKKEVEYGSLLGLDSAKREEKKGQSLDQLVDKAGDVKEDNPGSLNPGSDDAEIIRKDHQTYKGGAWQWD